MGQALLFLLCTVMISHHFSCVLVTLDPSCYAKWQFCFQLSRLCSGIHTLNQPLGCWLLEFVSLSEMGSRVSITCAHGFNYVGQHCSCFESEGNLASNPCNLSFDGVSFVTCLSAGKQLYECYTLRGTRFRQLDETWTFFNSYCNEVTLLYNTYLKLYGDDHVKIMRSQLRGSSKCF